MSISTSTEAEREALRTAAVQMALVTQSFAEDGYLSPAQAAELDPFLEGVSSTMFSAGIGQGGGSAQELREDLANSTDPNKGAAMNGRATVSVASMVDLLLAKQDASQLVIVNAFYPGVFALSSPKAGDVGQGTFRWSPNVPRSLHNGGTIVSPTVPWSGTQGSLANYLNAVGDTSPMAVGCWVRVFLGPVSVLWFGAVGDGLLDDTAAATKAHSTAMSVHYPANDYLVRAPLPLTLGATYSGDGSSRFSGVYGKTATRIKNDQVGGGVFWYVSDTSFAQKDAPSFRNLQLQADYPIVLNPLTGVIAEGAGSNIPYLMKPVLFNLSLSPRVSGTGNGIALTKCFDGSITLCDIRNFDIQLILQGCDLNVVKNNRLSGMYTYGILELGIGTFGSQNFIEKNDIINANSASAVFIKTTSRHVRLKDNYMEQGSGGAGTIKGFVDMSAVDVPVYGANTPSTTRLLSVECDNRLDGHSLATDFINRLEPVGTRAVIKDSGTTGPLSTNSWLSVIGNELPLFFNTTNSCIYDFQGGTQINSAWKSFKTSPLTEAAGRVGFSAQSLLALNNSELRRDNNHLKVALTQTGFVLKPTLTTVFNCILPTVDGVINKFLASGVTYNVSVVARAKTGTPTLRIARLVSLVVQGAVIDTVLSAQDKVIKFTMVGGLATDTVGLGFRGVAASEDIEVSSVSFEAI